MKLVSIIEVQKIGRPVLNNILFGHVNQINKLITKNAQKGMNSVVYTTQMEENAYKELRDLLRNNSYMCSTNISYKDNWVQFEIEWEYKNM
jgi:hypothetical protein